MVVPMQRINILHWPATGVKSAPGHEADGCGAAVTNAGVVGTVGTVGTVTGPSGQVVNKGLHAFAFNAKLNKIFKIIFENRKITINEISYNSPAGQFICNGRPLSHM